MTLSKKEGVASLNVKNRFAEIVQAGYLLEANTGFFGLNYSTQNKHPLSGTSNLFTSRTIISSLLMDNLKKLNDRRLFYYADPAASKISAWDAEAAAERWKCIAAGSRTSIMTNVSAARNV